MSKINCSLIKDLLPLYIDDLCSKESTEIVGNHLEICEDCNKEYETLKTEPKVKPQEDNSKELIKKVNKKFGKDKKKAIIKTISIILAIIVVAGVVAFFKVPPYIAQEAFRDTGTLYPDNYEEWEICNAAKNNFTHKAADLYIDEKYGEYTIVDKQDVLQLNFEDGKSIAIYYRDFDKIPSFEEDKNILREMSYSHFMIPSVIKKGLENLGVNTEVSVGYDKNLEITLIKTAPPEVKFFSSYDDYATACAYYSSFNVCMPIMVGSQYYLLAENEEFTAWGWSVFKEDGVRYVLQYQSKEELAKVRTMHTFGFTKEEAQEIFKYAVIK